MFKQQKVSVFKVLLFLIGISVLIMMMCKIANPLIISILKMENVKEIAYWLKLIT